MDAGHGCSTRISVGDCFKRSHGCLVGVVRPLCIDDRLQSDHPINPLSRPIFVALLKSLPFDGVNRFKGVDLGFVEPPGENMASAIKTLVMATLCVAFLVSASEAQQTVSGGGGQKHHQQKTERSATQTTPKVDEKAYNAALKTIPNKPYDPWFGTR